MRKLPLQCLIAVVCLVAARLVEAMLWDSIATSWSGIGVLLTTAVTEAFLVTPLLIAVHRLIILDEVARGYAIAPGQPRFIRFFGWSVVLVLASTLANVATSLMADAAGRALIALVLGVVLTFVSVRAILLFPAVAVDAPGAGWSNAWADTRGSGWDIVLIFIGAFLPLGIVAVVATSLAAGAFGTSRGHEWGVQLIVALPVALISAVGYVLAVVIASRLYGLLANRLKAA